MSKTLVELVDEKMRELGISEREWAAGLERDSCPPGAFDRRIKLF